MGFSPVPVISQACGLGSVSTNYRQSDTRSAPCVPRARPIRVSPPLVTAIRCSHSVPSVVSREPANRLTSPRSLHLRKKSVVITLPTRRSPLRQVSARGGEVKEAIKLKYERHSGQKSILKFSEAAAGSRTSPQLQVFTGTHACRPADARFAFAYTRQLTILRTVNCFYSIFFYSSHGENFLIFAANYPT